MQVRLLGPVDVVVDGAAIAVAGAKRQAILATLAAAAGEIVTTDRLIEAVWGDDPPATALNTLQRHVSFLRRLIGRADAIRAQGPGYVLHAETDVARAEGLVRDA